ncbi:hypothetical protein ACFX13_011410 [Malus domestica]
MQRKPWKSKLTPGFSRLTGAQARSLVQERCSADSGCNETECSSSGTVICLDNKCTCLEFLGGSATPPEIAQSPETGRCSTSRECEGKFKCVGDKVICSDGKCSCLDRQQAGNIRCLVLNDCRDLYCIDGRPKCVRHKCKCVEDPYSPSPSPIS